MRARGPISGVCVGTELYEFDLALTVNAGPGGSITDADTRIRVNQ
jgi:hypothetical protein